MNEVYKRRVKRLREHVLAQTKQQDLSEFTINELRQVAKERGIKGYNMMKKKDLIDLLEQC